MSTAEQLLSKPLVDVAESVRSREVSPVELTRATLDRMEEMNPATRTFITSLSERALEEAREAEAAILRGEYRGPLHGIPFSIKDCIATKGIRTTAGSRVLADYVPDADSAVAARTSAAGGVLVGKNNLHEFAMGATNDNPHYGRCGNPWDLSRIPGGSSGASASAVAFGMSYFSFGTDGAGSVRIPASLCGVVGLKASQGIISRYGMVPPIGPGQDHSPGILARSVEDLATVLQAVAGHDGHDPETYAGAIPDYRASLDRDLKGFRIGVPTNFFFDTIDAEVGRSVRAAVDAFAGMGLEVEETKIPYVEDAWAVTFVGGLSEFHRKLLRDRRDEYGDDLRYRLLAQEFTLAHDVDRSQRVIALFKSAMAELMTRYDALLTPTMAVPAHKFDAESLDVDGRRFDLKGALVPSRLLTRLTRPGNMAGLPGISVPCGFTASGLPIGLQIMGKPLGDATILALAHQYGITTQNLVRTPPAPHSVSAG